MCGPSTVNSLGLSDTDLVFNSVITYVRQLTANGLPPSMVGETYAQLLRMADPEQNVVVASPREPLATQGANALIEPQLLAENQIAAVPFGAVRLASNRSTAQEMPGLLPAALRQVHRAHDVERRGLKNHYVSRSANGGATISMIACRVERPVG